VVVSGSPALPANLEGKMNEVRPADMRDFKDRLLQAASNRDRLTLESMIDDGFTWVDPDGRIVEKQEFIEAILDPSSHIPRYTSSEQRLQVLAGGSLIRETGEARIVGTFHGRDLSGYFAYTAMYARQQDNWVLVSMTLTKLTVEAEIDEYYDECMEAARSKDRAALERLFHEDFFLVDDRGNVVDRDQMIESVLHAETNFTEFLHNRQRVQYQVRGGTIREVSELRLTGKYRDPTTDAIQGTHGYYVYHATYVQGEDGGLRVIASTITNRV